MEINRMRTLLRWMRLPVVRQFASLVMAASLVSCGGGGGDSAPPPTTSGATISASGGTVTGVDGATVIVPAKALTADTTIRIALDSTGAPVLPTGLEAAGEVHAITPHGAHFAVAVEVRIPAPTMALQPNQVFKLAKAEVNGEWTVLWDSQLENGVLTADVHDFSFFMPVVVTYPLPMLSLEPLKIVSVTMDCGGQDCGAAIGPVDVTYTVTLNNGQLPSYCEPGTAIATMDSNTDWWWRPNEPVIVPLTGGSLQRRVSDDVVDQQGIGVQVFWLQVSCQRPGSTVRAGIATTPQSTYVQWMPNPIYPDIRVLRAPATLEVMDGGAASLDVMISGGGAQRTGFAPVAPTVADRAVVEWQRSDDAGRSWRSIALSYQDEADPMPIEGSSPWRYWSVHHGFIATQADNGALLRVRACYTPPPAVTAPPCAMGPATQLVLIQNAAVPAFSTVPSPMLVRTGQTASFTATATGAPAPTLQWQTRDANSSSAWADAASGSGATTGSYTTPALTLADNGRQYRVVATNALGSAESVAVTASVSDLDVAPTITTQPASLAVTSGGDAVFAIAASGTEALSYQWRLGSTPIVGANSPVLKLSAVDNSQAGNYSVVVSNSAGSEVSNAATLTVSAGSPAASAPTIVTQPTAVTVDAGNTATFAVGVAGTAPYSYQWFKGAQAISGATAAYFSIASAAVGDAGSYSVTVTNAVNSVSSAAAILSVTAAAAPVGVSITTQPSPQVQLPGGGVTFAVAASGTGPLSYQWLKDAAPINGAIGPVLVLGSVNSGDAGSYSVTVSNAVNSVSSSAANLAVIGSPSISSQPTAQSVTEGATASFSVTAVGNNLRYQWTLNGVAISGATSAIYTTTATALSDSGSVFGVVVYNGVGIVFSQSAVLTVTAPVLPTSATQADKVAAGALHTCAVTATNQAACWGYNSSGQIGTGTNNDWNVPYVATTIPEDVAAVAAGGNSSGSSCALTVSGRVWCWGGVVANARTPTAIGGYTGVRWVAVGGLHACMVTSGGSVYCWGNNSSGQLGTGTTTSSSTPVQVMSGGGIALTGAVAVSAGSTYACALLSGGSVSCWGGADLNPIAKPVLASVRALAAGDGAPCARLTDGTVSCWGFSSSGPTVPVPVPVAGVSSVVAMALGSQHRCTSGADGVVRCWGTGLMGNGNLSETQANPTVVAGLSNVVGLAAGFQHTCALRGDGTMSCWGSGSNYQLGQTYSGSLTTPTDVPGGAMWAVP